MAAEPGIGLMGQLTPGGVLDDVSLELQRGEVFGIIALDWRQNQDLEEETVKEIKRLSEEHGLKLIVHTPFYLPTSTILPELKEGVLKNVRKALRLANDVGADRLTIHPGYREMPGPALDISYGALTSNLKDVAALGKEAGVAICLENFDNDDDLLCKEPAELLKVLGAVEGLKVTLDVGHAHTTSTDPEAYFGKVKDRLLDMHVHDNNGKADEHAGLGKGNIDFKRLFRACKDAGYHGPFILELFPYETILAGKKAVEELWKEA